MGQSALSITIMFLSYLRGIEHLRKKIRNERKRNERREKENRKKTERKEKEKKKKRKRKTFLHYNMSQMVEQISPSQTPNI